MSDIGDGDLDGLSDEEEAALGTDPESWDTDRDGLSDGTEAEGGTYDALDPDTDRDGVVDGDEHFGGRRPDQQ